MGQFVGTATIDNSQTEVVDISIMWENYGYLINIWKWRAPQKASEQKTDRDPFDWLLKLWRQFPAWKMRWKTLFAPEKFPHAPEKRIFKGIAESLEILKTNSLHLVLSALYDILVFETISRDFEHYSFNA